MDHLLAGLVVREQSGFFWVETEDGSIYRCRLRGRLLEDAQSSDVAAIGDRVMISLVENDMENNGSVESVLPRISVISRAVRTEGSRGAGSSEREQVIVANVDQAFFVFAAANPAPSPRMLDRFLVIGEKSDIDAIFIVVNKMDLARETEDPELIRKRFQIYEQLGYHVIYTSAITGEGVEELSALLKGKVSVFTGPSGVGKTSLLNRMQPGLGRSVRAVSEYRQEGMHTTRDSELVRLEGGGYLADTPGLRTLTIWDVEPEELDGYFVEIARRVPDCRFNDCKHREEPGCAVRAAVESGEISQTRYKSYLALRTELEEAYALG